MTKHSVSCKLPQKNTILICNFIQKAVYFTSFKKLATIINYSQVATIKTKSEQKPVQKINNKAK